MFSGGRYPKPLSCFITYCPTHGEMLTDNLREGLGKTIDNRKSFKMAQILNFSVMNFKINVINTLRKINDKMEKFTRLLEYIYSIYKNNQTVILELNK